MVVDFIETTDKNINIKTFLYMIPENIDENSDEIRLKYLKKKLIINSFRDALNDLLNEFVFNFDTEHNTIILVERENEYGQRN